MIGDTKTTRPTRFLGRSQINAYQNGARALATAAVCAIVGVFVPILAYDGCSRSERDLSAWPFWVPMLVMIACAGIPTRVVVGEDGVLVSWLRSRFWTYGEIRGIARSGKDAVLTLTSGARVRLPAGPKHDLGASRRRDDLIRLVRERLDRAGAIQRDLAIEQQLTRGGRDRESWAKDLRALTRGDPFRSVVAEIDALWRVLESPGSPPPTRVGAALALRLSAHDPGAGDRIREVAASMGSRTVRRSLEAIAAWRNAEGEPLEDVLDRLPESGREARRRGG